MTIQIAGRHMSVGDALQQRISDGLEDAVTKYFDRAFDGNVTVEKRGYEVVVDCNVHLPSGITLQSTGKGEEPYAALEQSLEKLE
ncbi:MAG: ribosome-associated translation inhibitor RaiA, partial [Pseudomonadota bacterium]